MREASQCFSAEDRQRIIKAVEAAEGKTSAEIMPVVATSSGRYDRPEDMVGVWLGIIAMVATWFAFRPFEWEAGDWSFQWASLEVPALIVATVLGFIIGAMLGSRIMWLRALFTPRTQMRDEVAGRARMMFFDNRVHHTEGGTGLLIYISMFERMAAVIADDTVTEKLGQGELDALCNQLTARLRDGDLTTAMCETIESAGEKLGNVLPRADDDVNELGDALVCVDGL